MCCVGEADLHTTKLPTAASHSLWTRLFSLLPNFCFIHFQSYTNGCRSHTCFILLYAIWNAHNLSFFLSCTRRYTVHIETHTWIPLGKDSIVCWRWTHPTHTPIPINDFTPWWKNEARAHTHTFFSNHIFRLAVHAPTSNPMRPTYSITQGFDILEEDKQINGLNLV